MAGFLKNIAARMEGSEKMLRPRPLSLFEPAATVRFEPAIRRGFSAPIDENSSASSIEQVNEIDAAVAAQSQAVPGNVSHSPDRTTGILIAAPESAVVDRRLDSEPPDAGDPVASGKTRGASRRAEPASMDEPSAVADGEAARTPPAPERPGIAIRPATAVTRAQTAPVARVRPVDAVKPIEARPRDARRNVAQRPTRPSDAASSTETPADGRESLFGETRETAPEMRGILQAPAVARIVSEPLHSAPRAPKAEPTIHVTIGRVEVRAVTAPPPDTVRTERPSPVMSLHEYLRTRAR